MVTTLVISYRLLTPKIIFEYQKLILFADVLQPKKSLIEPGSLSTQSRAARASNQQLHSYKEMCMFCGFKKHHGDTGLAVSECYI